MMNHKAFLLGIILSFLSIILGALESHYLKLDPEIAKSFQTAVRYQMFHSLVLLIISQINFIDLRQKLIFFRILFLGVMFFCGGIYLHSFTQSFLNIGRMALVIPLGGLLLIISWIYLGFCVIRTKKPLN